MKKTFFNNSTRGGDLQTSTKTKRKFLRTFSFTSLALLMGAAGVFAFAPLGANPSVASANTLSDEINTKADGENIKYAPSALGLDPENDPVIYTTESGLEIKYGGENVNDQIASGNPLSGYPYFTMGTYNGYAVNWVIIGRNTNDTVFTSAISAHLFSTWKTNNSASSATFENKGYYFFKNTYESTTPAGSAINGVVPSKSYVADVTKATKTVVGNDEVPQGCVLAISEYVLDCSWFNATSGASSWSTTTSTTSKGGRYRYIATNYSCTQGYTFTYDGTGGTLYTKMLNLYNSELSLTTAQKNMIQGQKLKTAYCNGSSNLLETSATDGNTSYYLFPLAGFTADNNYSSSSDPGEENFKMKTYLTSNALRKAYQIGTTTARTYWARSGEPDFSYCSLYVTSDGVFDNAIRCQQSNGVRPAGVFKLG